MLISFRADWHSFFMDQASGDVQILKELLRYKMPFGKHKDQLIRRLPMSYLEWFAEKGFPEGKLGNLLQTMYEIKLNGLEHLLEQLERIK